MKRSKSIVCLVITSLIFLSTSWCKKEKKSEKKPIVSQQEEALNTKVKPQKEKETQKDDLLKSIKKISKTEDLKDYLKERDFEIRKTAIARLGEIGGEESVKILSETFHKEPRVAGTDARPGIHGEILKALSKTGEASAKENTHKIIRSWLQDGPKTDGLYSHIYDSQYYAILNIAIESIQAFPDHQTLELLKEIEENPSLFYSLRESAYQTLLQMEMKREGIKAIKDKVTYLLTKIETQGVLLEKRWTGNKPGEKSLAAGRQAVVENLIMKFGFNAVDPLVSFLKKLSPDDPMRTLATTRMLSLLLVQELRKPEQKDSTENHKNIAQQIINALGDLSKQHLSTKTTAEIYDYLQASAEILNDQNVWEQLKKVNKKINRPGDWQGKEPTISELGLLLPQNSVFIASFSRRIKTPYGTLLKAYYFNDLTAEEIVKHYENVKGRKAKENSFNHGEIETSYLIKCWPAPQEVERFLELGVTVFKAKAVFEERAFGQILRTGKTMFRITKLQ
ncbi:MAG: HEAT repeat domain-containing protein [Candidatus Aminicenantes bacterium]|jgi:hypothetical protein